MTRTSPEQQLIDMAEQETDPILKELLYGTAGVKLARDAWAETQPPRKRKL
jgi:hypothetical protein